MTFVSQSVRVSSPCAHEGRFHYSLQKCVIRSPRVRAVMTLERLHCMLLQSFLISHPP